MSCYPGPKDVGKVWNVLTRNGKGKKKKVVIKDSGVAITDVSQAISDVATLKTHQHTIEK